MRRNHLAAAAALALLITPAGPAHAFFGFGGIVYDPRNHAQNLLTAARSMRQINNQVRQLANEARMLANQMRNLERLPGSVAGDLQASLARIDGLVITAEGIAYRVSAIDTAYRRLFPDGYAADAPAAQVIADAQEAWALARAGFKHALEVQAGVVGEIRADAPLLDRLVAESQGAAGHLQALQAGNQLTALAAKQSMQLQALLAASARADAISGAREVAAREQARTRFARFMGGYAAYTRR